MHSPQLVLVDEVGWVVVGDSGAWVAHGFGVWYLLAWEVVWGVDRF